MIKTIISKQALSQFKKAIENFKINEAIELCSNEAQTRKFLIEPFFMILNYVSNDLIPEYNADFGDRVSQKIDYAILLNKKDIILIEAKKYNSRLTDKEAGQLNGYFNNTKNSRIAILTNGIEYKFFSDVLEPNVIDSKPFFTFNLNNFTDKDLETLIYFDKRFINVKEIIGTAQESVFADDFENAFYNELKGPSKDLLKIIHRNMTFKVKLNNETQEKMLEMINSTLLKSLYDRKVLDEADSNSLGVVTTAHEIQAYHTIRTLLIQDKKIPNERITYRDFKSFFNINIDDNSKKIICKLMFTNSKMKIIIDDKDYILEHIDDLLKYKQELINRTKLLIEN